MPRYDYRCNKCERVDEHLHSMKEDPEIKCPDCDKVMERLISPNFAGFNIKGGTASIHWKEKRNRVKKNADLDKRMHDRYKQPEVAPNIAGIRYDSWSDARKIAKESGMDHSTFDKAVAKEKKNKTGNIYKDPS